MKRKIFCVVSLLSLLLLGVSAGSPAPDFTAKNQDGKSVKLSEQKGKFVLMYFYPKDDTPGCTKQACDFRDRYKKIRELNTVVFGVSRQGEKSHREFALKHKLPFDLLVDEDGKIGEAFGIGAIPLVGLSKRESLLIGPDGRVLKFYRDVDPAKHVDEVIADITAAKKN